MNNWWYSIHSALIFLLFFWFYLYTQSNIDLDHRVTALEVKLEEMGMVQDTVIVNVVNNINLKK